MNSFWNTITTPLRFFEEQEEPTIPPPNEPIQIPTVYEELPASRALSFEPESPPILPEEHDFPVAIDPETLGAEVLAERLNNLRIIEEIEAIQRRRSSLHASAPHDEGTSEGSGEIIASHGTFPE